MRRVAIVQARMTSTRLRGKVLMPVAGRPMLAQQLRRIKRCALVDAICVATTTNAADEPLVSLAHQEQVDCYRGSEQDVLSRFVGAAQATSAEVIVRVTGDCPLIDPNIVDQVIRELITASSECDYASNVLHRTFPRGLDVEALFLDTLLRVDRLASSPTAREHVTTFIYAERPDLFLMRSVRDREDNSALRWTVDTAADLSLIRALYHGMDLGDRFSSYQEILAYVKDHPEVSQLNVGIETWEPPRMRA
jgi:spore coat polysaccharide biosynthesis protein SpsF